VNCCGTRKSAFAKKSPYKPNRMGIDGPDLRIYLTGGRVAIADAKLYETVRHFRWHFSTMVRSRGYVRAAIGSGSYHISLCGCWRGWWGSVPLPAFMPCKLFILQSARNAKTAPSAESRYTVGTGATNSLVATVPIRVATQGDWSDKPIGQASRTRIENSLLPRIPATRCFEV
jgi:hypothetical protein